MYVSGWCVKRQFGVTAVVFNFPLGGINAYGTLPDTDSSTGCLSHAHTVQGNLFVCDRLPGGDVTASLVVADTFLHLVPCRKQAYDFVLSSLFLSISLVLSRKKSMTLSLIVSEKKNTYYTLLFLFTKKHVYLYTVDIPVYINS